MPHDQHGRVGPPRCGECDAPLGQDDGSYLCRDCTSQFAAAHSGYLDSIADTRRDEEQD
jgi:hypothetical protein